MIRPYLRLNSCILSVFSMIVIFTVAAHADCEKGEQLYIEAITQTDEQSKIELLEKAVAECHDFAGFYELAGAYIKTGEYSKAELALRDARREAEGNTALAKVFTRLGVLYQKMGKMEESIFFYQESEKLHPNPKVEKRLKLLAEKKVDQVVSADTIVRSFISQSKALCLNSNDKKDKGFYVKPSINLYVNFNLGKHTLTNQGENQASELGKAMTDKALVDKDFIIIGHTDSIGNEYDNQGLSERRANTVKRYLISHFSIESGRLSTEGKGESELLVSPENTERDYAMNRRVEIKIR